MTKVKEKKLNKSVDGLPEGWRETTLGEVVEINIKTVKNDYLFKDILYLDTGSIFKGKIKELKKIKLSEAPSRAKRLVERFDIVYSTVRPNQEHYGFIKKPEENLVVSTGFAVISANQEKSYPKFLYYFLTQKSVTGKMQQIAEHSVSTYPSIKPKSLENLKLNLPPLSQQKAIAGVLSAFDDKIELLREQNETLEKIGETIFKEWFLPNRQTGGKYKVGDDLSDGWRVGKLEEEIETFLGGTPSKAKKEYWENGNVSWVNSGKVNDFRIIDESEMITEEAVKKSATKLLPKGTIVLAITGATLGQYSRLEIDACFNQSVVGLKENKKFHSSYIYFWLAENIQEMIRHASGGAHQHINKENINQTDFLIPKKEILNDFYEKVDPIMEKISENMFQIQTLSKTRDTLLPRLMKGEIKI